MFAQIIRKFIKTEKKILGRWNIEHCNAKLDRKIDLSNEDHCGPCGQYRILAEEEIAQERRRSDFIEGPPPHPR